MKLRLLLLLTLSTSRLGFAGLTTAPVSGSEQPSRFDLSVESAYLLGIFGNPHSYEINANFITARVRWGNFRDLPDFLRGYNQVYLSAIV
jgi:hypothetical protein